MGTRTDTITKRQMEAIWARPGCEIMDALCVWLAVRHGKGWRGTPCNTSPGEAALAFRRRWLTHDDFPSWAVLSRHMDIEPSAELKARYKADCPNNYRALIAGFGKLDKWDAKWHDGRKLPMVRE